MHTVSRSTTTNKSNKTPSGRQPASVAKLIASFKRLPRESQEKVYGIIMAD